MAIGINSYGSVADVAALTRRFTSNGSFDTSTIPTLAQVEKFIDNVSSLINMSLAGEGFAIPITQADAKQACDSIVVEVCSELVKAANSTGRYFTERALENGVSPMRAVRGEIYNWVVSQISGFAALGVSRSGGTSSGILSRDSDESGDAVNPLFTRKSFSGTNSSMGFSEDDD